MQVPSLAQAAHDAQAIWKFATSHADTLALREFADTVEKETLGLACEWSWHDQVDIAQATATAKASACANGWSRRG